MVRELVATKWVGLAVAIWVQASAGNTYMFTSYSPALKAVLHCNQLQLNNLGVAKDFGENVGLIVGLLCNKLPAWTLLCTGALLGCLGYSTLYLVVSEQIASLPYWQLIDIIKDTAVFSSIYVHPGSPVAKQTGLTNAAWSSLATQVLGLQRQKLKL